MNQPIEEKWKIRFRCEFTTTGEGFGDRKWYGYPSPDQIESFIENLLEQERKRMSDEVNKLLPKDWAEKAEKAKKEGDMYTGGFFMGMIDTVEKVLQILKR